MSADSLEAYYASMKPADVDFVEDFYIFVVAVVLIGLLDLLCQAVGWFPESKSNTRYFTLHVAVNAYVTIIHFKDVVATYADPANAIFGPCDRRGSLVILALHLYHIAFYRPLALIDWIHHGIMAIIMLPLAYAMVPGHLLGHGSFYASGLPGGIDYLMLVLVKKGWMRSIDEKRYNVYIQLWIRAPGCVIHALLTWLAYLEAHKRLAAGLPVVQPLFLPYWAHTPAVWVIILSFFWNGLFFLNRVIVSHTMHTFGAHKKEQVRSE
eukprot:m.234285 g.234285  ORF g.234285 m.234285 type:complete len:266 (+) comp19532_c0_seq1:70-867(+)